MTLGKHYTLYRGFNEYCVIQFKTEVTCNETTNQIGSSLA